MSKFIVRSVIDQINNNTLLFISHEYFFRNILKYAVQDQKKKKI